MQDSRVQQAREHHEEAASLGSQAGRHLSERDRLVRDLYREGGWSYQTLARAIGCSKALIAQIVQGGS